MPKPRPTITLSDMDRPAQATPVIDDRTAQAIALDQIAPSARNPRQDLGALNELAASLSTHGLLQPILVRPIGDRFEIIAGHRRYAAAQALGWSTINCVVRTVEPDDAYVLTLVENLQRDDLSAREEASGLETLLRDRGWSVEQVCDAVKRSRAFVSKRLRVFDDPILAPYVLTNRVSVTTAEETLGLKPKDRAEIIERAATLGWDRALIRRAVERLRHPDRRPRGLTAQIHHLRAVLDKLQPGDLTVADLKELALLFKVGRELGKQPKRRRASTQPVLPTITPSGKVYVPEDEESETGGLVPQPGQPAASIT